MNKNKSKEEIRKKVCLIISEELYKKLNREIAKQYGTVHGHIGRSID